MMNRLHLFTGFFLGVVSAFGQSTYYTKYTNTPLEVNPALISNQQWYSVTYDYRSLNLANSEALRTNTVTFLSPVFLKKESFGGAGLSVFHDQLDNTQTFNFTKIQGAFSYDLKLTNRQTLSGGVAIHYGQYHFSLQNLSTGSQYTKNAGFNPDMSNGEEFQNNKATYLSYSPGFVWRVHALNSSANLGFAVTDLNEPTIDFGGGEGNPVYRSFNIHGGLVQSISDQLTLKTDLLYKRRQSTDYFNGALSVLYNLSAYQSPALAFFGVSLNYIQDFAVSPGIFLGGEHYEAGINFDMALGGSIPANATEIYVALRFGGKKKAPKKQETVADYSVQQIRKFYEQPAVISAEEPDEPQELKELSEKELESKYRFKLSQNFKFGFNEAILDDEARLFLDNLYNLLNENRKLRLDVTGHSDDVGTEEGNLAISKMRADAVRDYLIGKGISGKRIISAGKGASEPVVPNISEANRAKNRRVEFLIYE